jgi:hypothetical protein
MRSTGRAQVFKAANVSTLQLGSAADWRGDGRIAMHSIFIEKMTIKTLVLMIVIHSTHDRCCVSETSNRPMRKITQK